MDLLMLFSVSCLAIGSAATRCHDNQHCSDCDNTTGDCTTDCDRGYYDQKCRSACSKNCRSKTCITSNSGSGNCTDGCVLGYQGLGCNIPCDSPGGNCTTCPGGCDGGYCQLGSSCVSGCVDSYYGTGCKSCSSRCKSCNGITGVCRECQLNYFGHECEYSCENCVSGRCNETGWCTGGCEEGWYGVNCSSQCNSKCLNTRCTNTGDCTDGCIPGYFGRGCESCPAGCWNNTCLTSTGSCTRGCSRGLYGQYCNNTCDACLDGECLQMTGTCIKGCHVTGRGCNSTCRNCSIADCTAQSCEGWPGERYNRGFKLWAVSGMFGFIISMLICIIFLKRKKSNREVTVTSQQEFNVRRFRQLHDSDHLHSDINDEDMIPL